MNDVSTRAAGRSSLGTRRRSNAREREGEGRARAREVEMSDAVVDAARALADANVAMDARFSALFRLRSLGTEDAVRALVERLDREREASALMRHEVAFALGQMGATGAIEALCETLADSSENGMVRHECAEALGALGSEHARCVEALRTACVDEKREVAETAALALRKLERHGREMSGSARGSAKERASASVEKSENEGKTPYLSVDPVPAMPTETDFEELRRIVCDEEEEMWNRYGAMFALRNKSYASRDASDACADVLGRVLGASASALLKHEVCYVLGQLQSASPGARDALIRCLEDTSEHPMVRHEAAEALGSIAHESTKDYLTKYAKDPEPIIAESCEVALSIMHQEQEGFIVTAEGHRVDATTA
jgi:deoxyhypusine monooxygenase